MKKCRALIFALCLCLSMSIFTSCGYQGNLGDGNQGGGNGTEQGGGDNGSGDGGSGDNGSGDSGSGDSGSGDSGSGDGGSGDSGNQGGQENIDSNGDIFNETETATTVLTKNFVNFSVVYPSDGSVSAVATNVDGWIGDAWNVDLSMKTDAQTAEKYEILIGATNRSETQTFLSGLSTGEYGYTVSNYKVVIAGLTAETTKLAALMFKENILLQRASFSAVYMSATDGQKSSVGAGQVLSQNLAEYTVVYGKNDDAAMQAAANGLKTAAGSAWGGTLSVDDDEVTAGSLTDGEKTYEILIGSTNRAESTAFINSLQSYEYGYTVSNWKVVIAGKSATMTSKAIELFKTNILQGKTMATTVYMSDADKNVAENQEQISVMSFNLQSWNRPETRYDSVAAQITAKMPDSLGIQEGTTGWMAALTSRLTVYEEVGIPRQITGGEYSSIYYRKDKFNLITWGTKWLTSTPDTMSKVDGAEYHRIVTYVLLERKSDGKRFIHANTHLEHQSGTKADNVRRAQLGYLLDIIESINTGNYPLVITGDFNADKDGATYNFLPENGLQNVAVLAESGDSANTYTFNALASAGDTTPRIIDFIFVEENGKFDVKLYDVCNDATVSDHFPVYVEMIY